MEKKLQEWRENAVHMYERLDTISLEWPSLTAQWSDDDQKGERAFVATYTNGEEDEFVREVMLDTNKIQPGDHLLRQWPVPKAESNNEVQKIRQCPIDKNLFATIAAFKGHVHLWHKSNTSAPVATLDGHGEGGFGLAWEPVAEAEAADVKELHLVSGTDSGSIIVWKVVLANPTASSKVAELDTKSLVNDVTWDHPDSIVAALDDGSVLLLDKSLHVNRKLTCHDEGVNSATLSPFAKHLLVTGSSDKRIRLWDVRRPENGLLYENTTHEGGVNVLKWSPEIDGVFASAGMDAIIYIWDIRNIGKEQSEEDAEDGAPELVFKHSGHINGGQVQDLDWHPTIEMLLLSADEKNVLMSWQPKKAALGIEEDAPAMPSFMI